MTSLSTERRRLIRSAPPAERPWQYSESETESETDSSETSSVTTSDTSQRPKHSSSQVPEGKRNILRDYKLVEEVALTSLRDDDTLLDRGNPNYEFRRISFDEDTTPRRTYKKHRTSTARWDIRTEDKRKLQSSSVFEAARTGDVRRLQIIIQKYPNIINSKNGMGNTPLHIASQEGKIEVVKWLALHNAQLEMETPRGYTAMHLSALTGNVTCIRVLAAMGAEINRHSSVDRKTPLHLAAMRGNLECVKWLVANGHALDKTDERGETARVLAEKCEQKMVAEFLKTCEKDTENPRSLFTRMKSTGSFSSDQVGDTVTREDDIQPGNIYKSVCDIGSLMKDYDGTGLYQPIDIQLRVGLKHKIDHVTIHLPSGREEFPAVNDRNDGTISVIFQPSETGSHDLDLYYTNGKKGGSIPFNVSALNTSRIEASGHGLRHTLINEASVIWIETKDAFTGTPLNVRVDGDSPPPTPEPRPQPPPLPPPPPPPRDRKSRCELSLSIPVHTSTARADIIFALDASASVGEKNFEKQLDFVTKMIENHRIGPDHVQCSLITFATTVRNEFPLNKYHNKESLLEAIGKTEYHYGKTLTGEALRYIRKKILTSAGARGGCQQIVIVLTDGASTNKSVTLYEAKRLRETGATVIAIGVGKKINKEELETIASDGKNVFRASSFATLNSVSKHIKLDRTETWSIRMSCVDKDKGPPSATFFVHFTAPFNMTASVTRPSGAKEKCIVNKIDACQYCIKFLPVEVGVHKVEVRESGEPIPGSPFEFMIEPAKVNEEPIIYEVKSVDPEPEREPVVFEVEKKAAEPYEFKVYSRDYNTGNMSVIVEGPSKASFKFDNRKNGKCGVYYTVTKPGEYLISVKNDDEHIDSSPFTVKVSKKCSYVYCDCKPVKIREN